MDKPKTVREILENLHGDIINSKAIESDTEYEKATDILIAQAEAEINAIYSPLSVEEIIKIMKTVPHALSFDATLAGKPPEIDWDWEYANLAHALYPHL